VVMTVLPGCDEPVDTSVLFLLVRDRISDPRLTPASLGVALRLRGAGLTLRAVARGLQIHVATLCRWQKRCPELRAALDRAAERAGQRRRHPPKPRPSVRWRKDCPLCRARVAVRKKGGVPFWRCGRWPVCAWASWRPRAPRDCPRCG